MRVIMSSVLSYCGGVERTLAIAHAALAESQGKPVYSTGQLIHNPVVSKDLAEKGLRAVSSPSDVPAGLLITRAHGMSSKERQAYVDAGFTLRDATCPVVSHNIAMIREWSFKRKILVLGEKNHAEVRSMAGIDGVPVTVLSTKADVKGLDASFSYAAFVQTTFDDQDLLEIKEALAGYDVVFVNHICPASTKRRKAVMELAGKCEAMVVVGGRNSANTRALVQLARERCPHVYTVESEAEITRELKRWQSVGVAAGASTAPQTIERVREALLAL